MTIGKKLHWHSHGWFNGMDIHNITEDWGTEQGNDINVIFGVIIHTSHIAHHLLLKRFFTEMSIAEGYCIGNRLNDKRTGNIK